MGYDLHITRREHWADDGSDISREEWLAYVGRDDELQLRPQQGPSFAEWSGPSELPGPWLDWSDGRVHTKNPDPALIDKMVAIARELGATVQGDDGETYDGPEPAGVTLEPAAGSPPPPRSLVRRLAEWLGLRRSGRRSPRGPAHAPFAIGDRVRDIWGQEHTVVAVDPAAEHGMGVIQTRRDDGTELGHMMFAHGLTPIRPEEP